MAGRGTYWNQPLENSRNSDRGLANTRGQTAVSFLWTDGAIASPARHPDAPGAQSAYLSTAASPAFCLAERSLTLCDGLYGT